MPSVDARLHCFHHCRYCYCFPSPLSSFFAFVCCCSCHGLCCDPTFVIVHLLTCSRGHVRLRTFNYIHHILTCLLIINVHAHYRPYLCSSHIRCRHRTGEGARWREMAQMVKERNSQMEEKPDRVSENVCRVSDKV